MALAYSGFGGYPVSKPRYTKYKEVKVKSGFLTVTAMLMWSATSHVAADSGPAEGDSAARLDELYALLKESDPEDVLLIEGEIVDLWMDSGSVSMNLLLERGQFAISDEDYPKAVEHLSALIDHAPEFAEAWNSRATAYYFMDEYALSLADIRQTLILNPRHFGALNGLGLIFEEIGQIEGAYKAYLMAQDIHPHLEGVNQSIELLRVLVDGQQL